MVIQHILKSDFLPRVIRVNHDVIVVKHADEVFTNRHRETPVVEEVDVNSLCRAGCVHVT